MPVIFITGCSTVIGFASVETLARNGDIVYATMRTRADCPKMSASDEDWINSVDIDDETRISFMNKTWDSTQENTWSISKCLNSIKAIVIADT